MIRALSLLVLGCVGIACVMGAINTDPVLPVFPENWFSTQYLGVEITEQGGVELKGAMYWQMDSSSGGFNRSAFVAANPNEQSTTMDWDGKTYGSPAIYYHNNYTCDYFCPIFELSQCDEAEAFCSYDQLNNIKYLNQTTFGGVDCDVFGWDSYLGPISMAQTVLYVANNFSSSATVLPIFRVMTLTPFGQYFGNITQQYGGYQAATPPASAWNVPDQQYCEQGDPDTQCSDDYLISKGTPLHMIPGFWRWLYSHARMDRTRSQAAVA